MRDQKGGAEVYLRVNRRRGNFNRKEKQNARLRDVEPGGRSRGQPARRHSGRESAREGSRTLHEDSDFRHRRLAWERCSVLRMLGKIEAGGQGAKSREGIFTG